METHEINFSMDFGSDEKTVYTVYLGGKMVGHFDSSDAAWKYIREHEPTD